MMKKQSGFTLIELVIVIVILGILAATAVPKFVDLQGDARASAISGVKAAMESAATLTYSQAAIQGIEKAASDEVDSSGIDTVYGYPAGTADGIVAALELSANDWDSGTPTTGSTADIAIYASGAAGTSCEVQYTEATSSARPTIEAVTTGC